MMDKLICEIELPYPPSGNHIWKHAGSKHYLTDVARNYYAQVKWQVAAAGQAIGAECKLSVECSLYPPDNRRRDLDNAWKVIADAITKAGVWQDDKLVRKLQLEWMDVRKTPSVVVRISQYE